MTLPNPALLDLAINMVRDERKRKTPIHLGAVLYRIEQKKLHLTVKRARFSVYCRQVLKLTPVNCEQAYLALFRRCYNFGLTEQEVLLLESVATLRGLCVMTKVAISREELISFASIVRRDGKCHLARIRFLGEERVANQAPTSPLSALRFTTKQAEILDFTLRYFRDQFDLSGAQTVIALCSLAGTLRSTRYGERVADLRERLEELEIPSRVASYMCPP